MAWISCYNKIYGGEADEKYNVVILGATGAVGAEFLKLIEERNFPFSELRLLASKRSAGKEIAFMGKTYTVEEATFDSFKGIDIALFAGGSISKDSLRMR